MSMLYRPERSQRKLEFAPAAPSEQQRSATAAAAAAGADPTTASWLPPSPEGNGASSSLSPGRLQQGVDCVDLSGSPTREGGMPSSSPHRLDGGGGIGGGVVSPYLPAAMAAGPAAATASSGPSLPQPASPRTQPSPTSSIPPPSPSSAAAAAMQLSSGGETNASAVITTAGGGGAGTSQQSGSQPLSAGSQREERQATAVGGDGTAKATTVLSAQVQVNSTGGFALDITSRYRCDKVRGWVGRSCRTVDHASSMGRSVVWEGVSWNVHTLPRGCGM